MEETRPGRKRWAVVSAGCWAAAGGALALSLAWMVSGMAWELDLIANLGAQWLLATLAALALVCALRRWRAAGVIVLACCLHLWPLMTGRARYLPCDAAGSHQGPGVIRVLHYNDSSQSDKQSIYDLMERTDADVIHLLAPPIPVQWEVFSEHKLEGKYPGRMYRRFKEVPEGASSLIGAAFVVSKWPIRKFDVSFTGPMSEHLLAGIVERPEGEFAVLAVHPRSPRDKSRWYEGNAVWQAAVQAAQEMRARGYPVVVMSDLNSTPSGYRSRWMYSEVGLLRCKPFFLAEGTHPDRVQLGLSKNSPRVIRGRWPLSIAIDDVLVTPGIEVEAWERLPFLRGEHTPIIVELRMPKSVATTSEANPKSR